MVTVQDWERIRRMYHVEGRSIREIMRETGCAYRTVKKMVAASAPPRYERQEPAPARKLGPYKERIEALLAENAQLPKKQRWTSPRIYQEIVKEGYQGAESTLRHYIGQVRKRLKQPDVYLPLTFDPGTDGQVDWGEAQAIIGGRVETVQLFCLTLSYSRRTFIMAFPSQKQEAFFAGHVAAFDFFGGVPHRLSYDNLKVAVKDILTGRDRTEQTAFLHFRGHYLFESHFCTPGAGHEKGRVEHRIGYCRRHYLVPLPEVASYAELNEHLLRCCLADDGRTVAGQPNTIGAQWQVERPQLRPLPAHPFDCCRRRQVARNRYSQVRLETNRYSVPCDQGGSQLTAKLYPFHVEIYADGERQPLTRHERCYAKGQEIIQPLHYLPLLQQRPGAFHHATPLRLWRAKWPPVYERLLAQLRQRYGEEQGIREFVAVLYLHRQYSQAELAEAIVWALDHQCGHRAGIELRLRQLAQPNQHFVPVDLASRPRLQGLGQQTVSAATYDVLVGGGS